MYKPIIVGVVAWRVKSEPELRHMSHIELEEQANILLYGEPKIVEAATLRQTVWLYIPSSKPIIYRPPTRCMVFGVTLTCKSCGRPRAVSSATMCIACYRTAAREKYIERQDGIEYWMDRMFTKTRAQGTGRESYVLPETPYFDETNIPAISKRPKDTGIK